MLHLLNGCKYFSPIASQFNISDSRKLVKSINQTLWVLRFQAVHKRFRRECAVEAVKCECSMNERDRLMI